MLRIRHILILLSLLLSLLTSCGESIRTHQLLEAERIVENNPDSALSILNSMNPDKLRNDDERMLRRLLILEANDLKYDVPEDDEEIKALLHYFIDNNRLKRIHPLVYYYAGRTYFDLNEPSKAIGYFKKALNSIPDEGDIFLECRIHSQIADLYQKNRLYSHALRETKLYEHLSDSIAHLYNSPVNRKYHIMSVLGLGSAFRNCGKLDSALMTYKSVEPAVLNSDDTVLRSIYYIDIATYYLFSHQPQKADSLIKRHSLKFDKSSKTFTIISQAEIEKYKKNPLLNKAQLKEVLDSGTLSEKYYAATKLAEIAEKNNDGKQLLTYSIKANDLSKQLHKIRIDESVVEMEKLVDQTELENNILLLKSKNQHIKIVILVISLCALLVTLIGWILYAKSRIRNTQLSLEIERMKNENHQAALIKDTAKNQFAIAKLAEEITQLIISTDKEPNEQHFTALKELLFHSYPNLITTLDQLDLKAMEYKDAMLIKINVPQKICAIYFNLTPQGVANFRKRLYERFCENCGFKSWREYIKSL
ncbi:MAG: hypothetical protein K2G90_08925 [Muribaculaceae bacterium]|nr:hypothetical protein [Muribaculaceae bacterium]